MCYFYIFSAHRLKPFGLNAQHGWVFLWPWALGNLMRAVGVGWELPGRTGVQFVPYSQCGMRQRWESGYQRPLLSRAIMGTLTPNPCCPVGVEDMSSHTVQEVACCSAEEPGMGACSERPLLLSRTLTGAGAQLSLMAVTGHLAYLISPWHVCTSQT